MIYKLSYDVAGYPETIEHYADTEIGLAKELLKMEMQAGLMCHNVKIEEVQRPEGFKAQALKPQLEDIARYAKSLTKAIHINH